MIVGAAEDVVRSSDPAVAKAKMTLLRLAGFDAVRVTSYWQPGLAAPTPEEAQILQNVDAASQATGVRVIVQVYHPGSRTTPLTDQAREEFAQYAGALVSAFPSFREIIIGNEPNLNRFWLPQFNPDGTGASGPAFFNLLARVYDVVKTVAPDVTVWGGALAPRGADRPNGIRHTTSPGAFLRDLGAAYRASGRTRPIMDGLAFHPYADSSAQAPDTPHPTSTTIGLADYDKLIAALGAAFDGTGQTGSTLPILYDEFGVEAQIPAAKAPLYSGTEPATVQLVTERVQAHFYATAMRLAFCQPNVTGLLLFHTEDERGLTGWQSGIYYADGTPKTSFWSVRDAMRRVRGGSIGRCSVLFLDVQANDVRPPTLDEIRSGEAAVSFSCSLDCSWQVRMLRASGAQALALRGYGLAGVPVRAELPRKLGPGPVSFEITMQSPFNPGTPSVVLTGPVVLR